MEMGSKDRIPGYLTDTHQEAERVQVELLRRAPTWKKVQMVSQLNQTVHLLAVCGLRRRHPTASPAALRRHLADLLLGPEVALRVFGPHQVDRHAE